MSDIRFARTSVLEIAYHEAGPADGEPVVLLHGFPYAPCGYDDVVALLAAAGKRCIVPYLRGYGPTRFLSPDTMRSGEQAAIGSDLLELLDALQLPRAVLAGYDWGGRAACVVAALWPQRVSGLLSCCGYQIQDIAAAVRPADPEAEHRYWYQYYFHTERGRAGLAKNRAPLARLLWKLWSPTWTFDDATFQRSAAAWDHADYVDVVIHSYRHRFGYAPGDPRYADMQARLATLPRIEVPVISVHGADDGVNPVVTSEGQQRRFGAPYERRVFPGTGHNPPQESPLAFADAVLALCGKGPGAAAAR